MSYREQIGRSSPNMPSGNNGQGVQVLGHFGPHRDTTITDSDGSAVATVNDTWTVALAGGGAPTDGQTVVVADGTTTWFRPGNIYELTVAGVYLGFPSFFAMEWGSKSGNAPAPALGDWAWSFSNNPSFVFVAKEGQEKLSLLLKNNGVTWGTGTNYVQVRRLS